MMYVFSLQISCVVHYFAMNNVELIDVFSCVVHHIAINNIELIDVFFLPVMFKQS